jgi:curved DNA-binding protein CbpA
MEEEIKGYFKILELETDASISEVKKAYRLLKALYSGSSIAISPVIDELKEGEIEHILKEIEEAYDKLIDYFSNRHKQKGERSAETEKAQRAIPFGTYSGETLRIMRRLMDVTLNDIAISTRIRIEHLENIEKENFGALPPEIYLKAYLKSFALYLSLNPKRVVHDYLQRYRVWKEKKGY